MRFAAGHSLRLDTAGAAAEACERAARGLGGEPADLALVFFSPHHLNAPDEIARAVVARTGARAVAGCSGEGVIGDREHEGRAALSVLAGRLPGVRIRTIAVGQEDLAAAEIGPSPWWASLATPLPAGERRVIILLADPFTIDADALVSELNACLPGVPAIGGLASAASMPGQNRLILDGTPREQGAVLVVLEGAFGFETIVSQGCRPIGKHLVITKAKANVIFTIGGRPALETVREVIEGLTAEEQRRCQRALHVGRVIDEAKESFGRGDFLVRNLVGVDPENGAIAVADPMRTGQTVQLHVRDKDAATEDLKHLLAERKSGGGAAPAGMLLFSCNGRGRRLFGTSDHDTSLIRESLGDVAIAGFFCGGEVGPIGGKNFLHGYTSSIGIFTPSP